MSSPPVPAADRPPPRWIVAALAGITVLVFSRVAGGSFLPWDDDINILGNPHLDSLSGENLRWMFSDVSYMRRYVPLTWLGWAVERATVGLTPLTAHLGNLAWHGLNVVLVYHVLLEVARVSLGPVPIQRRWWAAAAGALMWAVHPMRVEVVAWASGRIYLQAAAALFFALLAYLRYSRGGEGAQRWLVAASISFGVSLLTYPIGVPLVVVLVAWDWYRRRHDGTLRWSWADKLPFVVAAAVVAALTLVARVQAQGIWQAPVSLQAFGLGARAMQAFHVWAYYLWKPFFPANLAPVYTTLVEFNPAGPMFVLSAVAVGGVTLLLWRSRRRWPGWWALWVVHLALLVPMLGLTEHPHYTNDRYAYVVGVVPCVLLMVGLAHAPEQRWRTSWRVVAALATALAVLSVTQIPRWRTPEALFSYLYRLTEGSSYRADIALRWGERLRAQGKFADAAKLYEESLHWQARTVRSAIAQFGLGTMAAAEGRDAEAVMRLRACLALDGGYLPAYAVLARVLLRQAQPAEVVALLDPVAQRRDLPAEAQEALGVARYRLGRVKDAAVALRRAVDTEPQAESARSNLVAALLADGQVADALAVAEEGERRLPASAAAQLSLAFARRAAGLHEEALRAFGRAAELAPRDASFQLQWGLALAQAGQLESARPVLERAAELAPRSADPVYRLGLVLRDLGRRTEAAEAFRRALQCDPAHAPAQAELARLSAP